MPGITFDDPIFAAQAGAATEWGSVGGSAMVKIPVDLQLNRGASLELGIQALAKVDAQFSKFITAQVAGQVQAQARVQGQIQMPMNLFREVGFAVRLHAILEASAGIQVGIGLNVGDFMELAQSQLQLRGLPLTLFRVLMEEVEIGMSLFAKVAYTAQAYANLVATATLVGDDQTDPGFNFTYGYGYGLKGTSTLLFRDKELRNSQYFFRTDWTGGKYCSPGMDGSRSGGLLAASWAAMVQLGREGYLAYAKTQGDVLLVSVSSDRHVNKGYDRPFINENLRAENLAVLEFVDYVRQAG